ncbi:MAG: Transposase [Syntrophus sp. PtaB.Bin075]|jgi:putative transposase|nr:MAG: Transposase [Syntrophus sp. PtaB.Bin075]
MPNMRRQHDAAFKAKVALEALKEEKTLAQISSEYGVHVNQIRQWRQQLLSMIPELFSDRRKKAEKDRDELEAELYQQIGQLKVELDWLKKKFQSLGRR